MAVYPSLMALWGNVGLGSSPILFPLSRAWPISMPELDVLTIALLAISLAPAGVLVWGSIGARRFPDLFVLTIFFGGAALVMMAVTNLVFFYLAWEILALCCWGVGQWGTALMGRPGIPANASIAFGSICMFGALAILAWDSRSLEMVGLHTESPVLVQRLLLAACFFKAWGILGQAWRPIDGRSFGVSQGILATGGVVALGIYPLARLHSGPVDWSIPWQGEAIAAGLGVAVVAALASLGEAGRRSPNAPGIAPETAGTTSTYRALAYLSFSVFGWSVAMLGLQGSALSTEWMLWALSAGLALGSIYIAAALAGSGVVTIGQVPPAANWRNKWSPAAAVAGYVIAAAALIGVPPSVGFSNWSILTLRAFITERQWVMAGLGLWGILVFFCLCRLVQVLWGQKQTVYPRWPVTLAAVLLLDVGLLVWFSWAGTLPAEILSLLLGQGGQGG